MMEKEHYYGIDWLRVIACVGIMMMHMQANNSYIISGFLAKKIIPSFTDFVFLFMTISAFGMCVGYYDKVKKGKVNWTEFYKKRYIKVLPFFAIIVLADIVIKHDAISLIDAIPNLTLTRGFFPNNIEQIGVAWFLGLIFVFYAIFPLFCVFINTKKSGWIIFGISLLLSSVAANFYGIGRTNIIYSLPFFIAGGLIYLYREELGKYKWYIFFPVTIISVVLYYLIGGNIYTCLLVSATLLVQAISIRECGNKFISFLSGISMEIYLSHMVIFRVVEKLYLNIAFGNGWFQYIMTILMVFIGTGCFSFVVKKTLEIIENKMVRKYESIND